MSPRWQLTLAGAALVAVAYGLVRFSFGQFLPAMQADLGISDAMVGLVSSGVFLGACVALIVAASLTESLGPRAVAVASGLLATLGMALVAVSHTPWILAAALTLTGISTGLSMPPLAAAVTRICTFDQQGLAISIINAGSSVGIVVSGPIAIAFEGAWRTAYGGFAAIALGVSIWVFVATPKAAPRSPLRAPGLRILMSGAMRDLLLAAFLIGIVTAAFWSFGGVILEATVGWSEVGISLFWILIGVAGFAGIVAASLVVRLGIKTVHRACVIATAACLFCLSGLSTNLLLLVTAGLLFGATYMTICAVYVIWSMQCMATHPARGVAAAFFAIPLGQTIGTAIFGALANVTSMTTAVVVFALIGLSILAIDGRSPQPSPYPAAAAA